MAEPGTWCGKPDGLILSSKAGLISAATEQNLNSSPRDRTTPNEFATPYSRLGHAA